MADPKTIVVEFPFTDQDVTISDGGADEVTQVIFTGEIPRKISIVNTDAYKMSATGVHEAAAFASGKGFPITAAGTLEFDFAGWGDEGPTLFFSSGTVGTTLSFLAQVS